MEYNDSNYGTITPEGKPFHLTISVLPYDYGEDYDEEGYFVTFDIFQVDKYISGVPVYERADGAVVDGVVQGTHEIGLANSIASILVHDTGAVDVYAETVFNCKELSKEFFMVMAGCPEWGEEILKEYLEQLASEETGNSE